MDIMCWKFPHISGKWQVKDIHTLVSGPGANAQCLRVKRWDGTIPVVGGVTIDDAFDEFSGELYRDTEECTNASTGETTVDPWKTQVGGDHYIKLPIQPFQYSMANGLDPMQHTIIKYVTRFRDKAGIVDLEKAKQTIDLLIAVEQAKGQ